MTSFWLASPCFLTTEKYHFGHAVGESHPASTAEVTTAGYLHITGSIFQMLEFGHLHTYLPNDFCFTSLNTQISSSKNIFDADQAFFLIQ